MLPAPPDVILVEDDDSVRDSLKVMLECHGLTVQDYPSGTDLVAGPVPHAGCFVIDYHLPGVDGLGILASLRAKGLAHRTVLITGQTKAVTRLRAAAGDAIAVLEKPFRPGDLVHLIEVAVGRPSACRETPPRG